MEKSLVIIFRLETTEVLQWWNYQKNARKSYTEIAHTSLGNIYFENRKIRFVLIWIEYDQYFFLHRSYKLELYKESL